jgi:putative hemolysin
MFGWTARWSALIVTATLALAAGHALAWQATPLAGGNPIHDCVAAGGQARERFPALGQPGGEITPLAAPALFCAFTGGAGADPSDSTIEVAADTLFANRPSLAAIAYFAKPPLPKTNGSANPASVYCSYLGGSDQIGGVLGPLGGWYAQATPDEPPLQVCVFPDGSKIDAWGLAYHGQGIIRGADLSPLFRWRPAM